MSSTAFKKPLQISDKRISLEDVREVALFGRKVVLNARAKTKILRTAF